MWHATASAIILHTELTWKCSKLYLRFFFKSAQLYIWSRKGACMYSCICLFQSHARPIGFRINLCGQTCCGVTHSYDMVRVLTYSYLKCTHNTLLSLGTGANPEPPIRGVLIKIFAREARRKFWPRPFLRNRTHLIAVKRGNNQKTW